MNMLQRYLNNKGYKVKRTTEYILAEGIIPICLVAHLDTIHELEMNYPPSVVLYDEREDIMHAIGGKCMDDRAGVYAILDIIRAGYKPHIIFTVGEEMGALGAKNLVAKYTHCPFDGLKAIIQLDRHGSEDCVFYSCGNVDFIEYIESFGFKEAVGTFTDISMIAPAWGIAAVNLSIGYYIEHSSLEYLVISELEKTIEKTKAILDAADAMSHFKYIEKPLQPKICFLCNKDAGCNVHTFVDNKAKFEYYLCDKCYVECWLKEA